MQNVDPDDLLGKAYDPQDRAAARRRSSCRTRTAPSPRSA